jgi:hypothetical protein
MTYYLPGPRPINTAVRRECEETCNDDDDPPSSKANGLRVIMTMPEVQTRLKQRATRREAEGFSFHRPSFAAGGAGADAAGRSRSLGANLSRAPDPSALAAAAWAGVVGAAGAVVRKAGKAGWGGREGLY